MKPQPKHRPTTLSIEHRVPAPSDASKPHLVVAETQRWFAVAHRTIDLSAHVVQQKLLRVLLSYRMSAPGAPLSADFIFMNLWPDKLPSRAEVSYRLKHAVEKLHVLGFPLGGIVLDGETMYMDPELEVAICSDDRRS
jgi:hypothetical protein